MHERTDLFFPASTNVDLTISRCKKKLASLRRYIKSVSYLRSQTNTGHSRDKYDFNIKNNMRQLQLNKNEKCMDLRRNDEKKCNYKYYGQNEKKYNAEMNACSGIDSESSISYNSSFVNKLIERYYSTSKSKLPDLNNVEKIISFKTTSNLSTPQLRINNERKDESQINQNIPKNNMELNNIESNYGSYCNPKFDSDYKNNNRKENFEKQESPHATLLKQYDLETREIVDNLDKKIRNLERRLKKDKRKIKLHNKNEFQEPIYERLERSNSIESKLLSISVMPPNGISCFESSFLPYYCTQQEIKILEDLISIKGEIYGSSQTSIKIVGIGKIFCCHARTRFIDSIKRLYQGSINFIKLKLLIYIEEPEILLANTCGPQTFENKYDMNFYEFEELYETKKISRFLICLVITDRPMECFKKRCYTISNAKQVLPIYIININSISS
ncbi:unnamed protein product [Cryptosporidium hominis]|uniref:Uncharacterized protein n=1 Tax=Cryptosporidium hominis TaxID=237895 RepID=A0A0S4TCU9_CRYHO|nr:hypothetical protein [Cryptosporidium hominis TU502]OLQ18796.1 hypothetical protein ChTU502y2012_414g0015 [Cryptosporidium hominis]PPA64660.1 hypothetical protein ChUKH1_02570 [Cryptosporidium hominis]PPS92885.1 Uncharacterized protein GY17_00002738 [Cryptosporidium hominis]CUV05091.1 unnamed protein product [Cryptosporidium hominis]|eukprot:PPS92885.1 Uncharacterized protein GY17_00002738 [Cryptosporidium hominis]